MEGANDDGATPRPAARGKEEKAPAPPPPPPPPILGELNGGHRRGQRRPLRRRVRVSLRALAILTMAAAACLVVAEALLAVPPPSAAPWIFTAFVLWIIGKGLLFLSFMN